MTISVTITKPGVTDAYGRAMDVGTTYSVDDVFGLSLISQLKATDAGLSLVTPGITESNPLNVQYVNAAAIAAPTAQMLASYNTEFVLDVSPFTRYRSNGSALLPQAEYSADTAGSITGLVVGQNAQPLGSGIQITNLRGLRRFRALLGLAEYSVARIHCLGDSVTMGSRSDDTNAVPLDATSDAQGYVGRLRNIMARWFDTTPAGFMAANDSRVTVSGGTAVTSSVGALVTSCRVLNTEVLGGARTLPSTETLSFPVPQCTTIEILYLDSSTNSTAGGVGANTGTFSYDVDSAGATTTVADNTYPINYKKVTITGLANTTHTLLLTGVTGTCYIFGINYYGASGVVVSRFGLSGATCLDLFGRGTVSGLSTGAQQRISAFLAASAAPVTSNAVITSGSAVATLSSTSGLFVGQPIGASAQIPLPCWIASIDSSTQITMSAAATGSNAARPLFIGGGTTLGGTDDSPADGALWVIPIGHNDWQAQNDATYPTSVATFTTNMTRLCNWIAAAGGCVLFVGEPKSNASTPSPQTYAIEDYWGALNSIALATDHVACIQINKAWGTFQQGVDLGLQSSGAGVHPIKKGSGDMARLIAQALSYSANQLTPGV